MVKSVILYVKINSNNILNQIISEIINIIRSLLKKQLKRRKITKTETFISSLLTTF